MGRYGERLLAGGLGLMSVVAARAAHAEIKVTLREPAHPYLVSDDVPVEVAVESTYALSGVRAVVQNAGVDLSYSAPYWSGVLSLAALQSGSKTLVVTATDVSSGTGKVEQAIVLDRPPAVSLMMPEPHSVVRGPTRFVATCSEDGSAGCLDFAARRSDCSGPVLARGSASNIDVVVALDAYEGEEFPVVACAKDSAEQRTTIWTPGIHVDTSPWLTERERVGGWGEVLDFDASRLVWHDQRGLWLRDRATDQDTLLTAARHTSAFVSPRGAIWVEQPSPTEYVVKEARDGQISAVSAVEQAWAFLEALGNYAV